MLLRPAVPSDIPRIVALERTPHGRTFVGQWNEERHLTTLAGGNARYFVSETESGELQAYSILRGFKEDSGAIELKRIVVANPERGLGRRILEELISVAFNEYHAHRLFLDVYEDNARARHLYESVGFQYEGVIREAARRDGEYVSLRLMSMLDREYAQQPFKTGGSRGPQSPENDHLKSRPSGQHLVAEPLFPDPCSLRSHFCSNVYL